MGNPQSVLNEVYIRMKPRLPLELENPLPMDIVWLISTYLDHIKKVDPPYKHNTLQKELT
jgi:hypothetical protein